MKNLYFKILKKMNLRDVLKGNIKCKVEKLNSKMGTYNTVLYENSTFIIKKRRS